MNKSGKFSLITLVIVTLLMGVFIAFMNVSVPKQIKQELSKEVYELTGSRLTMAEDMQWSYFPFGIVAHKVVINNPPEFGLTPLATAEEVRFSVKLLPLFSHKVEIKKIIVKELNIRLIKTMTGKENWKRFLDIVNVPKENHDHQKKSTKVFMSEKPLWVLNITADLMYNSKNNEFSIPTFKVKIDKTEFNGSLTGTLNPSLSAKGEFQSEALRLGNLLLTNVHALVDVEGSLINLNSMTAKLYEGDYSGNILINLHSDVPAVTLSGKLENGDVAAFLKDVISKAPFTGKISGTTQLSFLADETTQMLKTLNGNLHLSVEEGVLHGVNIPALIEFGQSIVQHHSLPHITQLNQTDFGQLKGSFLVKNGVMTNHDLTLHSSQIMANGHGKIDLSQKIIDYSFNAGLVGRQNTIPIYIRGSFDNPSIGVASIAISQSTLDKNINRLKEKFHKRLEKFHLGF